MWPRREPIAQRHWLSKVTPLTNWVYVDETKRAGYVLAAVSVAEPAPTRQVVGA